MNIEYETPDYFFQNIDREFSFTTDVCATSSNAKLPVYFSPSVDGLSVPWGLRNWVNPPYDRSIGLWVEKAYDESQNDKLSVCLLPGRSCDTKWFHAYVMRSSEIRFVADRIYFGINGVFKRGNISSILVVFREFCIGPPLVSAIDRWGRPSNKRH